MAKKNNGEGSPSLTLEELASMYFEENTDVEEVIVTEDGIFFPSGIKGINLADQYTADKFGANGKMAYSIIKK